MGAVRPVQPGKLFVGLLSGDERLFDDAGQALQSDFGALDLISPVWPFTASDYYRDELGDRVLRRFLFFEDLIDIERLPDIKTRTNRIERDFCDRMHRPRDRRPVNIDPGYMTLSKLALATTKDYSHRLYLREGIYAEVTLRYHGGRWQPWPWTYADYAADTYVAFFAEARDRLRQQLAGA
ncbi:MAG: DUF4416 family protein [Phycisphaerales bacterium]|nr:MAG: DUF4416 family protein [Phycisphaerales bacterium]